MITFLVATDFSEIAENAVEYAAALAKQFRAKIILYNAFMIPVHAANSLLNAASFQALLDENQDKLKQRAEILGLVYNIEVGYESSYSFVEDELKNLLFKYDASLVVLGMSTKTLEQDLLGNTTTAAIKKMKFPVLAVPLGARFHGMKKVLFACDVLKGVPAKILDKVKELTADLDAQIEVFYVDERIEELKSTNSGMLAIDVISDGLDGVTYSHKNVRSNAVIREIEKEILVFQAELLIMVPRKYGFWASLVHKSKTRMVASGLNIPLLSIPL
jgi:nucleotide-binding universal stress UspA family protein